MQRETKRLITKIVLFYAILQIILADISYLYTSIYTLTAQIRFVELRYNEYTIALMIVLLSALSLFATIAAIFYYVKLLFAFIFVGDDGNNEDNNNFEGHMLYKRIIRIVLFIIISFISTFTIPILGTFIRY